MAVKIRKGDTVEVLTGKSKGTRGTVLQVDRAQGKAIVEKVNLVKRHQKAGGQNRQGGIIEKEKPISMSNLKLVHQGETTRVGFRVEGGKKVRWSKKHGEAIDTDE